jgi:hypothetical protein
VLSTSARSADTSSPLPQEPLRAVVAGLPRAEEAPVLPRAAVAAEPPHAVVEAEPPHAVVGAGEQPPLAPAGAPV